MELENIVANTVLLKAREGKRGRGLSAIIVIIRIILINDKNAIKKKK